MFCPVCGTDSAVRVEMVGSTSDAAGPSGVVNRCSKGHIIPAQVDSLAGFVTGDGEAADEYPAQFTAPGTPSKQQQQQQQPTRKTAPIAKVAPAADKLAARDSLKEIKARRKAIAVEVKRLEALRVEDEELAAAERAIEAARRAKKVRPLRSEVAS